MAKRKTEPVIMIAHGKWIALTMTLETSPDVSIDDLILKASRIVASRKKNAQEVIRLEGELLKKCPDLDS